MIGEDDILTALRTFLLGILPVGTAVVQGQPNRVAEPGVADFVVMTPLDRAPLATPIFDWDATDPNPVTIAIGESTSVVVQLDIHGPAASDNATLVAILFRSPYGCVQLAPFAVQPLTVGPAHQMAFINGENQYENRWTMNVEFQANPLVSTPAVFANKVAVVIARPVGI
jgi:hypothetical protein